MYMVSYQCIDMACIYGLSIYYSTMYLPLIHQFSCLSICSSCADLYRRLGVLVQPGNRFVSFVRCVPCGAACARGTVLLPRLGRESSRNAPLGAVAWLVPRACPPPVCLFTCVESR